MPASVRSSGALPSLLFLSLIVALTPAAAAQSRRDRVAELSTRMQAAEAKYIGALVKVRNADPDGVAQADSALEDMEDVLAACTKTRGCAMSQLLPTYKRLLKTQADAQASSDDGDASIVTDGDLPGFDVPESAQAESLLKADGQRLAKLVQSNPAVQAGIRRWLTDMRPSLVDSHENYQYMRHLMLPAFQQQGLPEALLFGIMAKESNGKVHVGSRAGAVGPLQFMPATGKRFGLGLDGTGFDTRYDPRAAAGAAARYMEERLSSLGGDIEMSLAAYNGGEGRAARVYRETGGRSFWNHDVYNQFPAETRDYVPMVVAAAWLYLHPKEYGLAFPKIDARPATIQLARAASMYELTICMGSGGTRDGYMRALRNLNPRYEADGYIPAGATLNATVRMAGLYARHCTQGQRADLARTLVASDPSSAIVRVGAIVPVDAPLPVAAGGNIATGRAGADAASSVPRRYTVQRGETLSSIARKFQCSAPRLAQANDIRRRDDLAVGRTLRLDGCRG